MGATAAGIVTMTIGMMTALMLMMVISDDDDDEEGATLKTLNP